MSAVAPTSLLGAMVGLVVVGATLAFGCVAGPTTQPATAVPESPTLQPATAVPLAPTSQPATTVPPAPTSQPATAVPPAPTPQPTPDDDEDQALPIPDKTDLKYPNLGSGLDQIATRVEEGEVSAEEAAAESPMHSGASVAVTIHLTGNVDDVVSFLEDNGGDPRNVGEDYIEAYVPVTLLGVVSEQPGVIRVREIIPPGPG